jgi:hypothetical protein
MKIEYSNFLSFWCRCSKSTEGHWYSVESYSCYRIGAIAQKGVGFPGFSGLFISHYMKNFLRYLYSF